MRNQNQKVIIAISGGVDSSVSAALLKRAGFDVVGIFMRFWRDQKIKGGWNLCCSIEAEKRARKIATILGIPFYVLNFEREFKKRIVDYFLAEYKKGRTPNPCIVCNKEIKFGLLLEKALLLGAKFLATGHYAKKIKGKNQNYKILKAKDQKRDQSYFLWQLSQEQLKHILFPLANLRKKEVRNLARKFNLPLEGVPESREICFVADSLNDFLSRNLEEKPGKIIDTEGRILGSHRGLAFYTIGQRKGIGILGGPYWVLKKDIKKNFLIVTKKEKDLYKKELIAEEINWISGKKPKLPLEIKAKIRYKQREASAIIAKELRAKSLKIIFKKPQRAITPGQSVVFYQGKELLGGGIIKS